jgi:glutamyl-tRNA reductase
MEDLSSLEACSHMVRAELRDQPGVSGSLVLATCNRFEVYLDGVRFHDAVDLVVALVREQAGGRIAEQMEVRVGDEAVRHLMAVTSGLDSMVVGEVEIAGQVRCAMNDAELSPRLRRLFQQALTTSKAVTSGTSLGAAGRSVASVALDLVESRHGRLAGRRAVMIGTGAYARIVVGELVKRDVAAVAVHSPSGRAGQFAQAHDVAALEGSQLCEEIAAADLLVACSGGRSARLDCEDFGLRDSSVILPVVDLSPGRDVTRAVGSLPGIDLLDLEEIGRHAPRAGVDAVRQAWGIVDRGVATFGDMECGRAADPAVVAMRTHISRIIDAEMDSVVRRYPAEVSEVVARSLRRVSNSLLHTPSIRAHELARSGGLDDYRKAMSTLFGIDVELAAADMAVLDTIDLASGDPAGPGSGPASAGPGGTGSHSASVGAGQPESVTW